MENSTFQLLSFRLSKFDFSINEDFSFDTSVELEVEGYTEVNKLKAHPRAEVVFTLYLFKETAVEKKPFQMEVQMKGLYEWPEDTVEAEIDSFLHTNAPAILLSYIRPFVTQVTSFSGFPPLILPLIDFRKNS